MGVGAPGRCRLASASRRPASLGLPARAAASIRSRASSGKAMKAPTAPSTNQPAMLRLSAVKMVKAASAMATAPISSASRHGSRPPAGDHGAAHQGRGRHAARAQQRHQGEQQRDQQAERRRQWRAARRRAPPARAPAAPRRSADWARKGSAAPIGEADQRRPAGQARRAGGGRSTKTSRSGAPRHFMVAMVRSRPARKLEMALPTPTPPTSSEERPIRPRNWVSRSSQKRMPPPASASPLTRQPASGKRLLSASIGGDVGDARRQAQAVFPVQQAAGLHQARFGHRLEGDHQARAEACEGVQRRGRARGR